MKFTSIILILFMFFASCSSSKMVKVGPKETEKWKALHLLHNANDYALDTVSTFIPTFAKMGINVLFYEVNYSYEFESHPAKAFRKKYLKRVSKEFRKSLPGK